MKTRPILFSAPMVRAILTGTKTQTRRVIKQAVGPSLSVSEDDKTPWVAELSWLSGGGPGHEVDETIKRVSCPYGQPGDRLWVRETWRSTVSDIEQARSITEDIASGTAIDYRETYIDDCIRALGLTQSEAEELDAIERWKPSIHMPRWAIRITLEIVNVRIEQLLSISETDAEAEGIDLKGFRSGAYGISGREHRIEYRALWESINGPGSWELNPWVWVIEFKKIESAV